jgi:c-di-GMP-related signal transduction protein
MTTQNTSEFFIGRQSILDRNQDLAGFELLFRSGQKNSAQFLDNVAATCAVINHAFNEIGFQTVLGKYRGFINVNDLMLMDDTLELLPKDRVVIELLETIEMSVSIPTTWNRCVTASISSKSTLNYCPAWTISPTPWLT